MTLDDGQAAQVRDCLSMRAGGAWLASEVADIEPRQNGKGVVLEARALAGPLLVGEPLVVWTAHEFKTSLQAFTRVRAYFDNYDHLRKRVKTIRSSTQSTEIILKGGGVTPVGARIAWLARSGGSGRGFAGVSPLILDEAYALTEEQLAAIMYATRAAENPQVIYASSAPTRTSNVLRALIRRGRASARAATPTRDLIYYEWCTTGSYPDLLKLVQRNRDLTDDAAQSPRGRELRGELFAAVAQSNRALGRRVTADSVIRELRSAGSEQFLREGLGVFDEAETGAEIDKSQWDALADPESRREGDVTIGVDVSPERDWCAIALYGIRADGAGHGQLIWYAPMSSALIDKIVEVRDALDPVAITMGRGTYASLREALRAREIYTPDDDPYRRDTRPDRGDLLVASGIDLAAGCGQLIDAVKDGDLWHVPAPGLDEAAAVAVIGRRGEVATWVRPDRSSDITALVALTLARWGYGARSDLLTESDYDVARSFG
jgi:hypothetical protein